MNYLGAGTARKMKYGLPWHLFLMCFVFHHRFVSTFLMNGAQLTETLQAMQSRWLVGWSIDRGLFCVVCLGLDLVLGFFFYS